MRRILLVLLAFSLMPAFGQTVTVLPFSNLSDTPNLDWLGESIAESIRETLATEGVLVLDRASREEAYRRLSLRAFAPLTRASTIKVGEVLDAERVVHGWFRVTQGSLELAVRVLDLERMQQSPEDSATAALEDLVEAQDRLARLTLGHLRPPGREPLPRHKPVRLDALESYIRGLMATAPEQKHRLFTQAARLDQGFPQPCFQLGQLLWNAKDYKAAAGWLERVPAGAPDFMEASFLLGLCRYRLGEWDKAAASFRIVAESVPLNEVWNNLGAALSRRNLPEAVASFRKAMEGDPNDAVYRFNLGYALWKMGSFEEAADSFRATLDLTPDDAEATLMLGRCLKKTPPEQTVLRVAGLERIKTNFEEMAYRQLRATLEKKRD